MGALIRKLTVDQWRAIDEEYRDRERTDYRFAIILITITLGLVLQAYVGSTKFILRFPEARAFFDTLPWPDLGPRIWWGAFKAVCYFGVPALCIRLVLRERIMDHGFRYHGGTKIWLLYLAMFLVVLPLTYGVSFSEQFLRTYPKYRAAGQSMEQFVLWAVVYGFQFFMLEFFFRGFGLYSLARYVGSGAIFIMVVPYAMIHFAKPWPETLGSMITGVVLGTISLRTKSIYGGVIVHCGVAWSMDIFALMRRDQLPW